MEGLLRLGLATKAVRGRIRFDVAATERLSELIAPFVPEAMRYKLNPDVAARTPFDPKAFEPGPASVLYDTVETEDVTDRPRGDTTFFCIDVDGTHNFVTAGGVVHNCRPPGNRDPQPIELENCRSYLLSQVELIEPSIICSLGNFSTKLLRGEPTGITRLHGQPEVIELGARAVRLYPIYHPAAALYTPRMLETLREDFARLPELLAMGPPEQPAAEPVPEPEPEPRGAAPWRAPARRPCPRPISSDCSSTASSSRPGSVHPPAVRKALQRRAISGPVEERSPGPKVVSGCCR